MTPRSNTERGVRVALGSGLARPHVSLATRGTAGEDFENWKLALKQGSASA
jgi:hypothetical protein